MQQKGKKYQKFAKIDRGCYKQQKWKILAKRGQKWQKAKKLEKGSKKRQKFKKQQKAAKSGKI